MPPDERLMKACQLDEFMSEFLKSFNYSPMEKDNKKK
jgi:hypothetical protein